MQASSIPAKYPIPFAENAGGGYIRSIPQNPTSTPGQASLSLGFPPLTFEPVGSGGIPPFGQDMNGIMNQETAWSQWVQAGGPFVYDGTFSTAIGGYPNGAILAMADGTGFWRSTVDNNTSNPDTGGANWISAGSYGVVSIALSSSNVTLTAPQWCKSLITISGTLSANVQVIFPTGFSGQWLIQNNCTGSFTVTAKTSSGTGVSIPQGGATAVWGDGVNIYPSSFSVTSVEPANYFYAGPTSGAPALPTFRKITAADLPSSPTVASGVIGASAGAYMLIGAPSYSATLTIPEVIVETTLGGTPMKISNFSQGINLTSTGAGGMDHGSAPANGYVSLYAGYGTAGTTLFACNVTASSTPVYTGAYPPSGITGTALVGIVPINGSQQFPVLMLSGQSVSISPIVIFSNHAAASSYTSQSIASAVPPTARTVSGNMGSTTNSGGGVIYSVAGDANGTGRMVGGADFVVNLEAPINGFTSAWTFRGCPIMTAQTIYWYGARDTDNYLEVTGYTF